MTGVHGTLPIHGHCVAGKRSPEFAAWDSMLQRCNNPKHPSYANYGGRGIRVGKALQTFIGFLHVLGKRPAPGYSVDRIDNNRGYTPKNVRWATRKTQQLNRRSNRILAAFGKSQPLTIWAEEYGVHPRTLASRVAKGWPVEKALTSPLLKAGRPSTKPSTLLRAI